MAKLGLKACVGFGIAAIGISGAAKGARDVVAG